MRIIGENIHILSPKVKEAAGFAIDAWTKEGLSAAEQEALLGQARKFFQESAVRQVQAGAWAVDLNIGPQKKNGHQLLPWLVETVQEVVDVPLCLDTTNLAAIEAACEVVKQQPIINSTSAEPARLETVPLVAAKYNTKLIAPDDALRGHPGQRGRAREYRARTTDPALRRGRPADRRPHHRPAGADGERLPAVRARVHRGRAHPAGDRRRRAGGPEQRVERRCPTRCAP